MADAAINGGEAHADYHPGEMDVRDHKATFSGFMTVVVWGSALIVMGVAALTTAFAIGAGWFAGVAVWALIGVVIGLVMKMTPRWWGAVIGTTLLFTVGGAVAALIASLA